MENSRPAWAGEHGTVVEWADAKGKVHQVPPDVKQALEAPFRGLEVSKDNKPLFAFFEDQPVYAPPISPTQKPAFDNVRTVLVCKANKKFTRNYAHGQINPGKLLDHFMANADIDDETNKDIAKDRRAKSCVEFMSRYTESTGGGGGGGAGDEALDAVVRSAKVARSGADAKEDERQRVLDERTVVSLSDAQIAAISYTMAVFFFMCRIPFAVVDNFFFRAFVRALNPAFLKHMPGRRMLTRRYLAEIYDDCVESTAIAMNGKSGKKTCGIDGKTDQMGRGCMHITDAKCGAVAYVKTKWFGKKEHTAEEHAEAVKEVIGNGEDYQAVVADNTSCMPKMFAVLQNDPLLRRLFYIGCCVHVLDLLCEDIAKIEEIAVVVANFIR